MLVKDTLTLNLIMRNRNNILMYLCVLARLAVGCSCRNQRIELYKLKYVKM